MQSVAALGNLSAAPNVMFMGAKFGSTGFEAHTWYPNTYPFAPAASGGPTEMDPVGPITGGKF